MSIMNFPDEKEVDSDDEYNPILRSLSMSRNVAQSMVDEVPHMIHLTNPTSLGAEVDSRKLESLRKSSSTSSLIRLRSLTSSYSTESNVLTRRRNSPISIKGKPESVRTFDSDNRAYGYGRSLNFDSPSYLCHLPISDFVDSFSASRILKKNDLLVGIVVSRWDNIVGPQCVYLWTEEQTSTFYPGNLSRLVKYVTDHTVDHQDVDGNPAHPSMQRFTLCLVPDLNLTYMSLSIRVPLENDFMEAPSSALYNSPNRPASSVPHAISVLANLKFLKQFLLLRPLVCNWLSEFSPKIGVLLCKNKLQSSMINSWCAELCKTVTSVKICWGQETIKSESASVAGSPDSGNSSGGNLYSDSDFLPPKFLSKNFWSTMLTSHLTTCGTSVIVGPDHTAVNQVIRFLLCFSTNQESYCSRYVLPTLPDTFMKGLFVQGLILGEIGEKSISFNQVTSNRYPSTHIELGQKYKIRQMLLQLHRQHRDSILTQELTNLWACTSFSSPPLDPFPHHVKETAGFVNQLVEELLLLPHNRRYCRLLLFRRMIHAKAIALIAHLKSIELKPKKDRLKRLNSIPEALGLDDQEYLIVQVAADKIRPGLLQTIQSKV